MFPRVRGANCITPPKDCLAREVSDSDRRLEADVWRKGLNGIGRGIQRWINRMQFRRCMNVRVI